MPAGPRRSRVAVSTRNWPLAAASDGRGDRSASRSGRVVAHSHGHERLHQALGEPVPPAAAATGRPGRARAASSTATAAASASGKSRTSASTNASDAVGAGLGLPPPRRRRRAACPASPAAAGRRSPAAPAGRSTARTTSAVPSVEPSSTTTTRRSGDPALVEQRGQAVADVRRLVAHREHDRDRTADRRRVGRRAAQQRARSPPRAARPATESAGQGADAAVRSPARPRAAPASGDQHRRRTRPAPQAAEPGSPSQPAWASAPPRVIQPSASSGAASPIRGASATAVRVDQQVEQGHEHHARPAASRPGWSAARCRCRAGPGCGMRPRPVAGLDHLRVEDDVPGGEDGRGHAMRTTAPAGRTGGPAASASTQLGQAIISQASGHEERDAEQRRAEGVAVGVAAVREAGGQPDRLEGDRGDRRPGAGAPRPVRAPRLRPACDDRERRRRARRSSS